MYKFIIICFLDFYVHICKMLPFMYPAPPAPPKGMTGSDLTWSRATTGERMSIDVVNWSARGDPSGTYTVRVRVACPSAAHPPLPPCVPCSSTIQSVAQSSRLVSSGSLSLYQADLFTS